MTVGQIVDFVSYVKEKTGRWPGLYGGQGYLFSLLRMGAADAIRQCWLWVSAYTKAPQWPTQVWPQYRFWQYTGDGKGPITPHDFPGIGTNICRDIFSGSEDELVAFWTGAPAAVDAPAAAAIGFRERNVLARDGVVEKSVSSSADARFAACVGYVLQDEGGNVDDPDDPGGRTSRGITQRDWNSWLESHPGLPPDVFNAPLDQIMAIYRAGYWDAVNGDALPAGVDYATFDYGILSGVGRAARSLQSFVGVPQDGVVGQNTIDAVNASTPANLVSELCADRINYMRTSPVWYKYGQGWTNRVNRVRARALTMISPPAPQLLAFPDFATPTYRRVAKTISPNRQIRRFGWKPDLPDFRDHLYSAPVGTLQSLPPIVNLTPEFEIYDQGEIGSCTANALAGAIQFDRLKNKQSPDFIPSRLFVYFNERVVENDVALDGGAYLRDGIKTLSQLGVCTETSWPYDASLPAPYDGGPFPAGSRPAAQPPDQCYTEALQYRITTYQRLTPTLAQLQGCLASGYPFVFGFSIYSSWYDQDPRPKTISLPTGAGDSQVGGHAVLCVGYDNETSLFKIRNSWGPTAGESGYFYMPYSYLTGGLASDFWVINAIKE
jgi:lysozyme family protein